MRVIFMGTPSFAVPSLRLLAARHQVVAVYARPDAISGRGGDVRPSPVALASEELGLEVRQPISLRDSAGAEEIQAFGADIICVAAYGLILPLSVLGSARLGAINVHASLLPRWRGAAPIQQAILAGDTAAGVSIMRMEEGLDTGPFCAQVSTQVAGKNAAALTDELARLGAQALLDALPSIADGTAVWIPQDESGVTYAVKVSKSDVAPDPRESAPGNVRRVRASMPAAPPRILLDRKGLTLIEVSALEVKDLPSGAVRVSPHGLLLGTCEGAIEVTRLKPDGKAEMEATAWLRGARLTDDTTWESAR